MFKTAYFIFFAGILALVACENNEAKRQFTAPAVSTSMYEIDNLSADANQNDEDTVNLKMTAHATKLVFIADDFERKNLSDTHVQALKSWWDSLPAPIQSKVKKQQFSVEVVSNIHSNENQALPKPCRSDAQIEQTGAALEKVIGSNTEMTYTVNTTVLEKVATNQPPAKVQTPTTVSNQELATTDILLVETVPVKLSHFAFELPLQDLNELDKETALALQYWWTGLPADLQEKIKLQEISIQLSVQSIDRHEIGKNKVKPILGLNSDSKIVVLEDILTRIIGSYRNGNKSLPFAKIQSSAGIEKLTSQNAHIRSSQYLRIQLRNNKTGINTVPSMY